MENKLLENLQLDWQLQFSNSQTFMKVHLKMDLTKFSKVNQKLSSVDIANLTFVQSRSCCCYQPLICSKTWHSQQHIYK